MATTWMVMCRVSGGVTGTREMLLQEHGATKTFATEGEAKAEAAALIKRMNHISSVAFFEYWAVQR